jgi:hypothetical protein
MFIFAKVPAGAKLLVGDLQSGTPSLRLSDYKLMFQNARNYLNLEPVSKVASHQCQAGFLVNRCF